MKLIFFKKENMGEKLLYTALKYEITPLIDICDVVLASLVTDNENMPFLYYLGNKFGLSNVLRTCFTTDIIHSYLKACALKGIAGDVEED